MLWANKLGCVTKLESRAKTSQFEWPMDLDGLAFSTKHDGMKKKKVVWLKALQKKCTA